MTIQERVSAWGAFNPGAVSLAEILRQRATQTPRDLGYTFVDEHGRRELTWAMLDRWSSAVASQLSQHCVAGDRALLLFPSGPEFLAGLLGCFQVRVIAVPTALPDLSRRERALARLRSILTSAEPTVLLTLPSVADLLTEVEGLPEVVTVATPPDSALEDDPGAEGREEDAVPTHFQGPLPDDPAILQFTSGSTRSPRGVIVTHANLIANSRAIRRSLGYTDRSRPLTWVPHFHDEGLVHGLLQPLYSGVPSVRLDPLDVVRRPAAWLRSIDEAGATHSGGPNFIYALTAARVRDEDCEGLDLSRWEVAYNAAEPIRAETLRAFAKRFARYGFSERSFYAGYGLAEATLVVTAGTPGEGPAEVTVSAKDLESGLARAVEDPSERTVDLIGSGTPLLDTEVRILDSESGASLPPGGIGEIVVIGPGVTDGYWCEPQATDETFVVLDGVRALKTGDLGFVKGEELFVTGRIKDLLVIRGRNLYPQDLELTAERSHLALRPGCGAAFSVDGRHGEQVVVIQEVRESDDRDWEEVVYALRRAVSEEHQVALAAVVLISSRSLPKTTSGKVQRQRARQLFLRGRLSEVYRWTEALEVEALEVEVESEQRAGAFSVEPIRSLDRTQPLAASSEEVVEDLLGWLDDWGARRYDGDLADERRGLSPHTVLEVGNRGLLGLTTARRYGGLGVSLSDSLPLFERLGALDLTLASFVIGHNLLGCRPIERFATQDTRERYLPSLASGRALAAFALTEDGAGSDPRSIAAAATEIEAGWSLRGEKIWSGSAAWSTVINVFARVEGSGDGSRGLSAFSIPTDSAGVRLGEEARTLGLRGMMQSRIHFDDVEVDRSSLLGTVGEGFDVAQDAFVPSRIAVAAVARGALSATATIAGKYASERKLGGRRLIDFPMTRRRLIDLLASIDTLGALGCLAANAEERRSAGMIELSCACKLLGAELLWEGVDGALQLLGGRGYMAESGLPQRLRDARVFRIFEGPSEVMASHLGARLLASRSGMTELIEALLPRGDRSAELAARAVGPLVQWADRSSIPGRGGASGRESSVVEIGYAVAWALAAAATESSDDVEGSTREWCWQAFDRAIERADRHENDPASVDEIEQRLERVNTLGREDRARETLLSGVVPNGAGSDSQLAAADEREAHPVPVEAVASAEGESEGREGHRELEKWLCDWVAKTLGVERSMMEPTLPFSSVGLDSVTAAFVTSELETKLGRPLPPDVAWTYPSVRELTEFLLSEGEVSLRLDKPGSIRPAL